MHVLKTTMIALTAGAIAALAGANGAAAADGKALFSDKGCVGCHGEDAKTPLQEGYPRLAGQNADYVFQQLKDIKSGARANGQTAEVMKPVLEEVSEDEMRALADYLGGLGRFAEATAKGASDAPGKALFLTRTCIACHGKEGNKPVLKTYPALAGQDKGYIAQQMKDIKSGARNNGAVAAMQPVMHLVTDGEIDQIADYLSNVK